jgi:hypothetical protein
VAAPNRVTMLQCGIAVVCLTVKKLGHPDVQCAPNHHPARSNHTIGHPLTEPHPPNGGVGKGRRHEMEATRGDLLALLTDFGPQPVDLSLHDAAPVHHTCWWTPPPPSDCWVSAKVRSAIGGIGDGGSTARPEQGHHFFSVLAAQYATLIDGDQTYMRTHEEGSTAGELKTEQRSVAEDAAYTGAEQGWPVRDAMRLHSVWFEPAHGVQRPTRARSGRSRTWAAAPRFHRRRFSPRWCASRQCPSSATRSACADKESSRTTRIRLMAAALSLYHFSRVRLAMVGCRQSAVRLWIGWVARRSRGPSYRPHGPMESVDGFGGAQKSAQVVAGVRGVQRTAHARRRFWRPGFILGGKVTCTAGIALV